MSKLPQQMAQRVKAGVVAIGRDLGRSIPRENVPSSDQRQGNYTTKTATFVTKVTDGQPDVLYSADLAWAKVTMLLETAGPVVVSTNQQINPILSGKGILLQSGQERSITIPKGSRLYIASTTVNTVSYVVEPYPWLEQLLGAVLDVKAVLAAIFGRRAS